MIFHYILVVLVSFRVMTRIEIFEYVSNYSYNGKKNKTSVSVVLLAESQLLCLGIQVSWESLPKISKYIK